jgi:predicted amidophosphoribosyltransferase
VWLVDLLLPARCAACGIEAPAPLCPACSSRLIRLRAPLCERCGCPTAWPVERCAECRGRRLAFARARAAVAYEGPAAALVRRWKEGGLRTAARFAAAVVASCVERPDVEAATFVPAVRERELWRGHNPARRLTEEVSTLWELPCVPCLARTGGAVPQRGLPLSRRRANVAGAFRATRRASGRMVLVDDVYTSGATAAAAAATLRAAGAREVVVVTFARALRGRPRTGERP